MIRNATIRDIAALRQCAEAAYAPYISVIGRRPAPMDADFGGAIAHRALHVCEDPPGVVAGFALFYPRGDHLHLENVAVLPTRHGRGLGRRLIAHCEAAAIEAGLLAVELYTNALMTANLSLYPRLGYREVARRREDGFDRVYFRKELPS